MALQAEKGKQKRDDFLGPKHAASPGFSLEMRNLLVLPQCSFIFISAGEQVTETIGTKHLEDVAMQPTLNTLVPSSLC